MRAALLFWCLFVSAVGTFSWPLIFHSVPILCWNTLSVYEDVPPKISHRDYIIFWLRFKCVVRTWSSIMFSVFFYVVHFGLLAHNFFSFSGYSPCTVMNSNNLLFFFLNICRAFKNSYMIFLVNITLMERMIFLRVFLFVFCSEMIMMIFVSGCKCDSFSAFPCF